MDSNLSLLRRLHDDEEGEAVFVSLGWRIGQIFVIILAGGLGMMFNLYLFKRKVNKILAILIQLFKGIGVGTILAVSMVHMLNESREDLGWLNEKTGGYESWNMVLCMMAIYFYSVVDFILSRPTSKDCVQFSLTELVLVSGNDMHCQHIEAECNGSQDMHSHTIINDTTPASNQKNRLISEISIVTHSVPVGVVLGFEATNTLLIATCFHQFLEGFAYANLINGTKNPVLKWTLISMYSLSTAIGQVIGIILSQGQEFENQSLNTAMAIISAFCSGLLLYTAVCQMLNEWVTHNKQMMVAPKVYVFFTYAGITIGIGVMTLIGKWA